MRYFNLLWILGINKKGKVGILNSYWGEARLWESTLPSYEDIWREWLIT